MTQGASQDNRVLSVRPDREGVGMDFQRKKDFLVCIDSDGCAMDTMNLKHYRAFGPELVKIFNLQEHAEPILHYWNKVNLFSKKRAINRFKGFFEVCRYIDKHFIPVDGLKAYEHFLNSGGKLSNEGIRQAYQTVGHPIFALAEQWSINVNKTIASIPLEDRLPFPHVYETIEAIYAVADIAVVSSANNAAVTAEWEQAGLIKFVNGIFTQENGSKKQILASLKQTGGYKDGCILKLGDAPGDLQAAQSNAVFFYPIIPEKEAESWLEFKDTYLPLFIDGRYAECEQKLIDRFYSELED